MSFHCFHTKNKTFWDNLMWKNLVFWIDFNCFSFNKTSQSKWDFLGVDEDIEVETKLKFNSEIIVVQELSLKINFDSGTLKIAQYFKSYEVNWLLIFKKIHLNNWLQTFFLMCFDEFGFSFRIHWNFVERVSILQLFSENVSADHHVDFCCFFQCYNRALIIFWHKVSKHSKFKSWNIGIPMFACWSLLLIFKRVRIWQEWRSLAFWWTT